MSRLFLVRHGETALKSSLRLWGHTDVELSDLGLEQAERLRDRLAPEKIDFVYSSDLKRALVTARTIASRHQLDITGCAELREFNYGKVEGLTFEEIDQLYPECSRYLKDRNTDLRFPDGEGLAELGKRVEKFIERLEKHKAEDTILVVAHSGVLRTLICRLLGLELKHVFQFIPGLASLSIVETCPGGAILNLFNSISHLDHLPPA
ncbi:MAG: histidine phosphatase family protein [Dehalococcoidales bacterium]|nr:histidine phosphatase family protein [Dehalococcoidales bacterium]